MDWLDLLAVQGTLKSLLQHYGSKASILQHSAFFIVQLYHLKLDLLGITIPRYGSVWWGYAQSSLNCGASPREVAASALVSRVRPS